MPQQPRPMPFGLNPARITLLILGVLAVVMIAGTLLGGLDNYQALKESVPSASSSSAP